MSIFCTKANFYGQVDQENVKHCKSNLPIETGMFGGWAGQIMVIWKLAMKKFC